MPGGGIAAGHGDDVAGPFPEEGPAERRWRGEDEDGLAVDLKFEAAATRAEKIPLPPGPGLDLDQCADGSGRIGGEGRQDQRFIERNAGGDVGGEPGLAFGEIGGLLAVHVVLVFGTAFLADRLVARHLRRARLKIEIASQLSQDPVAEGGFVHAGKGRRGKAFGPGGRGRVGGGIEFMRLLRIKGQIYRSGL